MDKFQYELLSSVKTKFEAAGGNPCYEYQASGPNESARQFYLADLKDNLITPMDPQHEAQYQRGSGNELDDKMRALRSSSAMTFNLLGNSRCTFLPNTLGIPAGCYSIEYEHQAPTLNLKGGTPANLDAWLVSDRKSDTIIACEMKMMEWLTTKPSALKDKYFTAENYFENAGQTFVNIANQLSAIGFQHYDWAQMFKHTVALLNEMNSPAYASQVHTLRLLNVVWEPSAPAEDQVAVDRYFAIKEKEEAEFHLFQQIMHPAKSLFMDCCGIDFAIEFLSASEFANILQLDDEIRLKLTRYF